MNLEVRRVTGPEGSWGFSYRVGWWVGRPGMMAMAGSKFQVFHHGERPVEVVHWRSLSRPPLFGHFVRVFDANVPVSLSPAHTYAPRQPALRAARHPRPWSSTTPSNTIPADSPHALFSFPHRAINRHAILPHRPASTSWACLSSSMSAHYTHHDGRPCFLGKGLRDEEEKAGARRSTSTASERAKGAASTKMLTRRRGVC